MVPKSKFTAPVDRLLVNVPWFTGSCLRPSGFKRWWFGISEPSRVSLGRPEQKTVVFCTPWKFKSSPLKRSRAPKGIPTIVFQGRTVILRGCNEVCFVWASFLKKWFLDKAMLFCSASSPRKWARQFFEAVKMNRRWMDYGFNSNCDDKGWLPLSQKNS